jgi:hypothetical protein
MIALIVFIVFVAFLALAIGHGADSRSDRPGRQL